MENGNCEYEHEESLRKRLDEIHVEETALLEKLKQVAPGEGDVRFYEPLNRWERYTREGWQPIAR